MKVVPWVLCVVLAVWSIGLFVQVQKLQKSSVLAEGVAVVETSATEVQPAGGVEALPDADKSELLKLRNEVHQLRQSKQEMETKVKGQEQQLAAAKAQAQQFAVTQDSFREAVRRQAAAVLKTGTIGVRMMESNNRPTVAAVVENSPAHRAGMKPGDAVMAVGGTNVAFMTFTQVGQAIRGDEGTAIIVEVDDGTPNGRRQLLVTRENLGSGEIRWIERKSE